MVNRNPHELFVTGESLAAAYLTKHGYEIITKNFRSPFGEVDIIATIQNCLVFVEVKTRKQHSMVTALASISLQKQKKISLTASYYINQNPEFDNFNTRFDVIVLFYFQNDDSYKIHHYDDAFLPVLDY